MNITLRSADFHAVRRGDKRFLRLGVDSPAAKGDGIEIRELGEPSTLPVYAVVTHAEQIDWVLFISIEKC